MDNQRKIRIGVAGAGKMGKNHIKCLSELSGMFDLVGVYDPVPERARIAEKYGAKAYDNYDSLLKDVEAVTLPCPTSLHKALALQAADAYVHALIEKPIAETNADAKEICEVFKKKGLTYTVGHIERFNPVVQALEYILKSKEVIAVETHRCSPFDSRIFDVDVVADLMIHDIDVVANAICKEDPTEIAATGKNVYSEGFADYAQAVLRFPSGVLAYITSSRCTEEKIRTIAIHAKNAYIEGDLISRTLTVKYRAHYDDIESSDKIDYRQSNVTEQINLPDKNPLREELKDFGEAIQKWKEPAVTGEQIIRAMGILDAIKHEIGSVR